MAGLLPPYSSPVPHRSLIPSPPLWACPEGFLGARAQCIRQGIYVWFLLAFFQLRVLDAAYFIQVWAPIRACC